MKEKYKLSAQKRSERGRRARRVAGLRVPATVYGQGMEPLSVWVDAADFARIFRKAGETAVIELSIDGEEKALPTIIRAVQYEPLKHVIIHVDFYKVNLKDAVTADVPVVLVGEAPAVKAGNTLIQNVDTLEVSALPNDLPHEIKVDVSGLVTPDDSITVADIEAPEKVVIVSEPDVLIASIAAARVEENHEQKEEESADTNAEDEEGKDDDGVQGA